MVILKKNSVISFVSLVIGIVCFFIVFIPPTRIANIGSSAGDLITFFLTALGIVLSIAGLSKKAEKKVIPVIALILSASNIVFWIITLILLFTGVTDFGP
ncbi:hypothetical protein [Peribacillus deserti]